MTATVEPTAAPRRRPWRSFIGDDRVHKLFGCLLAAVMFALITGPSGTLTDPTKGFTGSLFSGRVVVFLVLGVLLWAAIISRDVIAPAVSRGSQAISRVNVFRNSRTRNPAYLGLLVLAIILPHFLSNFWQEIAVDQIGVYVLLAIGLNVVVGFAGLLDLGYIAFYAIGAYSCAYWTGSLPIRPPHIFNPFVSIIFAVLAAMVAGVILGAPTLRLRGDYLAIVTLGFGEIITIYANNLGTVTGGAQGPPKPVPHFSVNLFGIHYRWRL
jgi:branched-chain amino acid transport system permease protein